MIMKEPSVNLLQYEMNIIMAALNNLSLRDEKKLEEEYGSVSALYNKIYTLWEQNGGKSEQPQKLTDPSF
jgi:hypothetical protein